jgi:hypothetical protein
LPRIVAVTLMSPLFLLGYAFASLFIVVPIYIALAIFGDTYTILPDTPHELQTAGAILAVLTGLFFLQGIAKAANHIGMRSRA